MILLFIGLTKEKETDSSIVDIWTLLQCRILSLMKDSTSGFNEEEFKKSCQVLHSTETAFDKNLTQGKVDGSIKVYLIFTA